MTAFGSFDESYPPEILRGYTAPVISGGAARRTVDRSLLVAAGEPGTYEPDVPASERPRNLDELEQRTRLASPAPWPAGAYVLYANGKRAHWSGEAWLSHESPGYPDPAPEVAEVDDVPTGQGSPLLDGGDPDDGDDA